MISFLTAATQPLDTQNTIMTSALTILIRETHDFW